mgnify:CR=1 FL=1
MRKLIRIIDQINLFFGKVAAASSVLLVIVVFMNVVMRYLFKRSYVFTQELEWHIFGFLFLIGAGYTLLQDAHVRVDIFYQNMSRQKKAWINFLGTLFFLIPGCILVIDTSWKFTVNAYLAMEGSPNPGGIPYRFLLKGCIPLGFSLLLLQGISMGIKELFILIGKHTSVNQGKAK